MRASFIITTYNASSTINMVLEQLLNIISIDSEIVIVDDGSNDKTIPIIKNFKDKRVNLISSKHLGRSKALNLAVKNSKGKYIFINDADDISNSLRFTESLRLLNSGYDAVFGQALLVDNIQQKKIDDLNHSFEKLNEKINENIKLLEKNALFRSNKLHHSSFAIKRDKLNLLGSYDKTLEVCIDLDLYFKLIQNKLKIAISNNVFIARNIGSSRQFAKFPKKKYIQTLLYLRKKYRYTINPSLYTIIYDLRLILLNFFIK